MNRKAALFISVILLTQVASYSFNQITPQIDWEEPFQGDSSWEATGRNATTGCGTNSSQTSISTSSNLSVYTYGNNPELIFSIDCAVVGTNYTLSYKVWGWNTGTGASTWLGGLVNNSFVATNTNFSLYIPISNLDVDNYSVNTSLYNTTYDPNGNGWYSGSGWNYNFSVISSGVLTSWSNSTAFYSNQGIDLAWNASSLDSSLQYNVTVDVYGHNMSTNTTSIVYDNSTQIYSQSSSSGMFYISPNTLQNGCYFVSFSLIDDWNGVVADWDTWEFKVGNVNCSSTGGNSTVPMEGLSAWTDYSNYSSSDDIDLKWNATSLDLNTNYIVEVDVYGYNMTTNTSSIVWSDDSVFNPTTHGNSLDWFHDGFTINAGTLSTGCYYASFNLSDDDDGMFFANTGFEFGVNMGCSSTGGNTTWPMESIHAWTNNANYSSSEDIDLHWNASDLVSNTENYNVEVKVYGHNMTTNTTQQVWNDDLTFSPADIWYNNTFTIPANTLSTGCYYASFNLSDDDDGMFFANTGFEFGVNMDCTSTGGNYTGPMESIHAWTNWDHYNSADEIHLNWSTQDLVWNESINYIVTVDLFDEDGTIVWWNSTIFSPLSDMESGFFTIPSEELEQGCYLAGFELHDWDDGMFFDDDGFVFAVETEIENCSFVDDYNNVTMEWIEAYSAEDEYGLNDTPILNWTAWELVWNESINYVVHLDVHEGINGTIVWSNSTIFSPTTDSEHRTFILPATTLPEGCYYVKVELLDYDDGMHFDYDYFEFSVGVEYDDCDINDDNNTGGNNSNDCPDNFIDLDTWTEHYTYDLADDPEIGLYFVVTCPDNGTLYSLDYYIRDIDTGTYLLWEMENWTASSDSEEIFTDFVLASDLGVGNYYLNATLVQTDCWGCPQTITYLDSDGQEFEVIDTSGPEYGIWNMDQDDCTPSGEDFWASIKVSAGPNEAHTVNWTLSDENGVVVGSYTQDLTTSANGSAYYDWTLDTSNLADGLYSIQLQDPASGFNLTWFYFQIGCTGCGYDTSLTEINYQIWTDTFGTIFSSWNMSEDGTMAGSSSNSVNDDTPQIIAGTELGFWGQIECLEFEQDYLLNYTVTNSANIWIMGDEEYFNSGPSTWYWFEEHDVPTTLLPAGEYCITVTLYVSPYGSSDVIYTFTDCVEIVPIEDWDGCGSNITYLQHMQGIAGNPVVQPGVVYLTNSWISVDNFVDCLVIGNNYTMHTEVTSGGSIYAESTDNFTVNQFSDITQWDWLQVAGWNTAIPVGNYCAETTIHSTDATFTQQIALVSTVTNCFAVVNATVDDWWDNQDNGTGNGSGTPNDPVLPDGDCDELNGTLTGLNLSNSWNMSDCENGTGFWFNLSVNGTGVTWYDPIYAVGYDYEVISGPKFSSVIVPPGYGDDKFDLYLWDGTEFVLAFEDLNALEEYWFTGDVGESGVTKTPGNYDGISKFSIRGLEISAKLDPEDPDAFVTGLSFVQDPNEIGEVILSMTPITVSDEDDDGIIDEDDNCVNDKNTDQADSDEDGVGDACEESLSTGDLDDEGDDSDPDSGSSMTSIIAILAVGLVFIVLFMRGGDDDDESPPQAGKKYYPFDQ